MLKNKLLMQLICIVSTMALHGQNVRSGPDLLSFSELVTLNGDSPIAGPLSAKLDRLLKTPFVSSKAKRDGASPIRPDLKGLGPGMKVAFWNIERGINLDLMILALSNAPGFIEKAKNLQAQADEKAQAKMEQNLTLIAEQLEKIQQADVIVLNEVDWGMKRSGYRAVIEELGSALKMNWAYGVEFVEVDSMLLGIEKFTDVEDLQERATMVDATMVDPSKMLGLHGTAVLSRYPILEARLIPFTSPGYDWFNGEKNIPLLESGKRKASVLLGERLGREVRRGGRTNLIVTLEVPAVMEGKVTIAATHLENRADPKLRHDQMLELLHLLKPVRNPVVIAGDLNTTGARSKPRNFQQSVVAKLGAPEYWAKTAVKYGTGAGLLYSISSSAYKGVRFQSDPTVAGVAIVASNPEARLFQLLRRFRFEDGTVIDFRGDAGVSSDLCKRSWFLIPGRLFGLERRVGLCGDATRAPTQGPGFRERERSSPPGPGILAQKR